jgi:hypothetical protein
LVVESWQLGVGSWALGVGRCENCLTLSGAGTRRNSGEPDPREGELAPLCLRQPLGLGPWAFVD